MPSPRVRRLQSDYERIAERFENWPLIRIGETEGHPPDKYRIWYNIKGLYADASGTILERDEHILEIQLGLEYPRRAPQLRLMTTIFHPNFNNSDVCAQDFYASSEGLDDLIIRIGRMISYQEYNTKSPLNGIAARWASENSHKLPVDSREIAPTVKTEQPQPPPLPQSSLNPDSEWEDQIVIGDLEVITTSPLTDGQFEFDCPSCAEHLQTSVDQIGEYVECPACGVSFQIPGSPDTPVSIEEAAVIRFICSHCQQPLEADATMRGDYIACPTCQNIITITN